MERVGRIIFYGVLSLGWLNQSHGRPASDRMFPDLVQTQLTSGKGNVFCGPVAVSNSLWFWGHQLGEYNPLIQGFQNQEALVWDLVERFQVDKERGAGPYEITQGLSEFLVDYGVKGFSIRCLGRRKCHSVAQVHSKPPGLEDLKIASLQPGGVWLNVGWYQFNESKRQYTRRGGHWLTLVGVGESDQGSILLLVDPSPRSGTLPRVERVTVSRIAFGSLNNPSEAGLLAEAKDYLWLRKGLRLKKNVSHALLDGAVTLSLPDRGER